MTTKHKLLATIPVGDPDLGAETEVMITFTYVKGSNDYWNRAVGTWEQGWGPEFDFVSAEPYCNGKPSPFLDYPHLQQSWLNDLARDWLETEDGMAEAYEAVRDDDEAAREYAAELRTDR